MSGHSNSIFSTGESIPDIPYTVLNEREIRGSAGIMLFLGVIAMVNGFVLRQFSVIPYITGFLLFNFIIGVFINPRLAPTMLISRLLVRKQNPLYIGAIQKRFAWSLGIALSLTIFILSLFLLRDATLFEPVCSLCVICLFLLYSESVFGICLGCKLYYLALRLKLIRRPEIVPNCMGDSCPVEK